MDGAMACMQEVDAVRQDALGHAASSGQSGDECEEDFAEQGQSMEQMLQNERRGKHNGLICAVPTCKKFARLSREGVRK